MRPENMGAQDVETPHNEGIGSSSCAVRCLLLSSESQNITSHPDETGGLIMATHTLETMLSHYTAVTIRESNVGNKDIDQASP